MHEVSLARDILQAVLATGAGRRVMAVDIVCGPEAPPADLLRTALEVVDRDGRLSEAAIQVVVDKDMAALVHVAAIEVLD